MSEDDIELLVRVFFDEFGGDIRGVRPGPARAGGDVFQLDVPDVLSGDQVATRYEQATFTREVAMEEDEVDFIALDHPLVQSLIEFCLDSDRIRGEITAKVAEDGEPAPGILFNYRLGYIAGDGTDITEKLVPVYVTADGQVSTTAPEIADTLPPGEIPSGGALDRLASMASEMHEKAEMEAWNQAEAFADEARQEREHEVEIKRKHAERHFEEQISQWEERLETYRQQDRKGKDMSAPIGNAKRELERLRREREEEQARLDDEKHVTPEEPELVTAAFILESPPGE